MNKLTVYYEGGRLSSESAQKQVTLPQGSLVDSVVAVSPSNEIIDVTVRKEKDVVVKSGTKYVGRVLDFSDKVAVIYDTQRRVVANYDEIRSGSYVASSQSDFFVSVGVERISWKCVAACTLSNDLISFYFVGVVRNETGTDVVADVTLVSGDSVSVRHVFPRARASFAQESSRPQSDEEFQERKEYHLGEMVIGEVVASGLSFFQQESSLFYKHYSGTEAVSFGYSFVAKSFVPPCSATLFTENLTSVIGTGELKEYREGETAELVVGETSKVRCFSRIERGDVSERIVMRIRGESYPFVLVLTHRLGDRGILRVMPENDQMTVVDGDLRFPLHVTSEKEGVVTVEYK